MAKLHKWPLNLISSNDLVRYPVFIAFLSFWFIYIYEFSSFKLMVFFYYGLSIFKYIVFHLCLDTNLRYNLKIHMQTDQNDKITIEKKR